MARWAIGDVQGCCDELEALLERIRFSSDRDQLWLVGDLVNRGPRSLAVLRLVRSLGDNAVCVLGNHDLHLLAVALGGARQRRRDTLAEVLAAPDCDALLEWLCQRPLAHFQPAVPPQRASAAEADGEEGHSGDLLVHAGVLPQWSVAQTLSLAREVERALRTGARTLLSQMYGDEPDQWQPALAGPARLRLTVNVLTRLRFCTAAGRIDLQHKGKPASVRPPLLPWFMAPERASRTARIVFGHWSALGLYRARGLLGLDTGCVWGGALTAVDLDQADAAPLSVASRQPRSIED